MITLTYFPGPDICGYGTKKVHVIINYKGQNHLIKKEVKARVSINAFTINSQVL